VVKKESMKKKKTSSRKNWGKINSELLLIDQAVKMLIVEYGYPRDRIKTYHPLRKLTTKGESKKSSFLNADVVVFNSKNQEEIIIEVKSPNFPLYTESNTDQLIFQMLESEIKFGMLYNGEGKFCFKTVLGTQVIEIPDIPSMSDSKISPKSKKPMDFNRLFFRTSERLRGKMDASDYSTVIISILYAKFIDEKEFKGKFFSNLTNPKEILSLIETLFQRGHEKYPEIYFNLGVLERASDEILFSIIIEANQFSILNSNPESIIQAVYNILEKETSFKKSNYFLIPESITLFLYKYLVSGAKSSDIHKRKLLLTHIGAGKTVFDVLQHLSDEFMIIGEELREFSKSNIVVAENNKTILSILKFLLILKGYHGLVIDCIEPISHSDPKGYTGIIGFPPLGLKISQNLNNFDRSLGLDYENHFVVKMIPKIIPLGYFATVVSPGFLFKKTSEKARRFILRTCFVKGIIQLPRNTYPNTSVSPLILLLQKKSEEKAVFETKPYRIFFSDLSDPKFIFQKKIKPKILHNTWEKFFELQTVNKILEEDDTSFSEDIRDLEISGDWRPSKHSPSFKRMELIQGESLSNYVEIIPRISNKGIIDSGDYVEVPEIRVSDISDIGDIKEKILKTIPIPKSKSRGYSTVKKDDILFSVTGTIGKFGLVTSKQEGYTVNSNIVIMRPT